MKHARKLTLAPEKKLARPYSKSSPPTIKGFIELIARTNFSFLQSASHPEEMVEQSVRLGYDGIAICDLNGLYGVVRGYQSIKTPSLFEASIKSKDSFKYLIGSELLIDDGSSLVLMPLNMEGYQQLCSIITIGKRQAPKGFSKLSLDQIFQNSSQLLAFAIPPYDEKKFLQLQKYFQDRLYLPVWKDLTWKSLEYYKKALELEKNYGAQLFATNRPFMHSPEMKPLFDVVTCIQHQTTLFKAQNILIQNAERHLHSIENLTELWYERLDLLEATLDIANRVEFSLSQIRYKYPQASHSKQTPKEYLRSLVEAGIKRRYCKSAEDTPDPKVLKLVEHELSLIFELEYEDYFLTLYEICQFAESKGILYQGRGSAANSIVCFAIGLTNVDPVKLDLLFERFISRERHEPPDIDIDFENERREEIIQHIYEKYDAEHAAMVCTIIRYRARLAIREAAKVFEVPLKTINNIVKYMGRDGIKRLLEPGVHQKFQIPEERWEMILRITQDLYGFPRHLGIHTGGFIITHHPLTEMVPVEKATMNGRYVIQWNKDDVNTLGLMKIDVLALGMLTALRKALDLLRRHKNLDYTLASLPAEDKPTYDMISRADTVGVFQIESRAQMATLPRLKPQCFYDLVIEIALIRPGPLQGGMVHPYLKRRQGLEKVRYPHPNLEPVLKKTLGIPLFQEQVMRIAVIGAGFTPGESDELRRIMSSAWRKKATMDGVRFRVLEGLKKNGVSEPDAEAIYKTLEGFANYGFPESHSASFALICYASCYLKHHHPEVFACALLNSQPMGFYPPRSLLQDALKHGVQLLPLDIQKSDFDYSLEDLKLRVGLRSIAGLPEAKLKEGLQKRPAGGFSNLKDLISKTSWPKVFIQKLAAAGALNDLCNHKPVRDLLWEIESLQFDIQSYLYGERIENFENLPEASMPQESSWDEMLREYSTKGFSIHSHPLGLIRSQLEKRNEILRQKNLVTYYNSEEIPKLPLRKAIRVVGMKSLIQRPPTAKGVCFITLEDEFGFINVTIPPEIYQKYRLIIYTNTFLEIWGTKAQGIIHANITAKMIAVYNTALSERTETHKLTMS